ncbi:YdeI/OmpD-associated family protein [Altibacter sp. HG106]|uniref:YdeI/OmpD-associated family protein n=1 Tax=Altibacter sp. HG106 TaxID=3023937 RepID=UPI0023503B6E|nr:YdeI/OmpD-associated family protein [Altibacter sp. HG106]MDC7993810.1 YdeI/OmpD-associated family protein [Altibacter sp. HG106]
MPLRSDPFLVRLSGSHSVRLPEDLLRPFLDENHSRLKAVAMYKGRSVSFHTAIKKYQGSYGATFGKRLQKAIALEPEAEFQLQLFEDTTKYGVDVPQEFSAVMESDPEAFAIFETFTDGKKRSLIYFVKRFTVSQTRIDKSLLIADRLKLGVRNTRDLVEAQH